MVDADAHALVLRLLAGDEAAWPRLWQAVEPRLYALLRRPQFLGRLSDREDDCRNIVVAVMARLREDGYARLDAYHQARRGNPGLPFMAWLVVVAKRVAIDYMRSHEEYVDRRADAAASSPGAWRLLETLVGDSRSPEARPRLTITDQTAAAEILVHAAALPGDQQAALRAWLIGKGYEEIADEQGLAGPRDAERAVRAGLERLRRKMRTS